MTTDPSSVRARTPIRVGGVIVTFHPDAAFETRLEAIAHEVDHIVVVDNTAESATRFRLAAVCHARGAQFVANQHNRGLAAALNQAFALLAGRGFAWAIAFDQDSTPQPGFTQALQATAAGNAAVTGANWGDEAHPDRGSRHLRAHAMPLFFERVAAKQDLPDVTCVITSGSLFQLSIWRELHGFDEGLFLDLVDSDFCLRARAAGYAVRVASAARMRHRRGAKRLVRFAGRSWWPAFMPESRLYYLFRNRMLLASREIWRTPHWVVFELVYAAKIIGEIFFFEDRKLAKLSACLHGTGDGLLGRSGPIRRSSE